MTNQIDDLERPPAFEDGKDYRELLDCWFHEQLDAEEIETRAWFKEGDVWWCKIGLNIGNEQRGKGPSFRRPILVLRKFDRQVFLGIPLSTKIKENPYYLKINFRGIEQSALVSQIRLLDAKRFINKMGEMSEQELAQIMNYIRDNVL